MSCKVNSDQVVDTDWNETDHNDVDVVVPGESASFDSNRLLDCTQKHEHQEHHLQKLEKYVKSIEYNPH